MDLDKLERKWDVLRLALEAYILNDASIDPNIDVLTQQKSALLAVLSHEIRTPMNGVMGMTSLCKADTH